MDQNHQPSSSGGHHHQQQHHHHSGGGGGRHSDGDGNNKNFQNKGPRRFDNNNDDNRRQYNSESNGKSQWADSNSSRDKNRSGGGRGGGGGRGRGRYEQRGRDHDSNIPPPPPPPPPPPRRSGNDNNRGSGGRGDDRRGPQNQKQYGHQQQQGSSSSNNPQKPKLYTPPSQSDIEKASTPIHQNQRRTLILSGIPPHLRFYHLQSHFSQNWNAPVQYSLLDRIAEVAYVRFKRVEDALRVWEGGSEGLDGSLKDNQQQDGGGRGGEGREEGISLVASGVTLKAIHFTNYMVDTTGSDRGKKKQGFVDRSTGGGGAGNIDRSGGEGGFDRKRNWRDDSYASSGGGGSSHHGQQQQPSKMPRYSQDEYVVHSSQHHHSNNGPPPPGYNDQYYDHDHEQYPVPPPPQNSSANPSTYPAKHAYHRSSIKQQQHQPSALELQLEQQQEAEYDAQYTQFQTLEASWRERRQLEYNSFVESKNARASQLSTLEQKRDLLTKQEALLNQQLPLHKKMLGMLKSKNAGAAEQSKKMKEILGISTRVMGLKKEVKSLVELIEKNKGEELLEGIFRPKEKRPVFEFVSSVGSGDNVGLGSAGGGAGVVDVGGKKLSLDRRTTMLKVDGFRDDVTEDAMKERFSTFGSVTSVSLEKSNHDVHDEMTPSSSFALINFANRLDAERAKSSSTKFNDTTLTCTWHNPPSSTPAASTPTKDNAQTTTPGDNNNEADAESFNPAADNDDVYGDDGLYDDVGDTGGLGVGEYEEESPAVAQDNEGNVNYDYDQEEEDFVDYD